ncbi:ATP-binding protein [Ideonella sp. YS5]|uniref:ATP-binding protein n=1 Tax=Ideonella sp. YS5 TaxID=3453714 RepID=UPI003F702645
MLASTFLALLATAVQLYLDYARDVSELDEQFHRIEGAYVASIANSLWSMDKAQVELQLGGLARLRDVSFARVQGQVGEHFEVGEPPPAHASVRDFPLRAPTAPHRTIGMLTVGVDLDKVYRRLADRALVILATQAIKTFFIALLILFIVRQWVTRRLERIAAHAGALTTSTLGQPLRFEERPGSAPDELDAVVRALNEMSSRLCAELARRTEAEGELRRHRDHLEHLVAERTTELQEAKERAESASRAKSDFLSRMSHELRSPLTAILGYAQLLKVADPSGRPQDAAAINAIRASGEHLLGLILDLLDLAKIEAGKVEMLPSPVDVRALVQSVADIMRVEAEAKRLVLDVDAVDGLPPLLLVDGKRLRQVLLNLLGNAVKFTPWGRVVLRLRRLPVAGEDEAMVHLRFEVWDTGPGIAPADQRRIFQPFEQAGDGPRRGGGTGLGLAISQQLVRLMGGRELQVESRPGQGSVFHFELVLPVAQAPSASPLADVCGYAGPRKRLLVADDLPLNRQFLGALLQPLGFGIVEAADGEQALAKLVDERPDLVLMDMSMPGLSGLEATRRIRGLPRGDGVPVIALTAQTSQMTRQAALAAGATAFLPKPVQREELLSKIGELLGLEWIRATEQG